MDRDVKSVQIHYGAEATFFPELCGETLRITLQSGKILSLELFEREPGFIYIRGDTGRMSVQPEAANSIRISV